LSLIFEIGTVATRVRQARRLLQAQGRLDEALTAFQEGLTIVKRLVAKDPGNTQWQSDLQFSIAQIGGLAYAFMLADNFTARDRRSGQ
jgi:hypothetical protein